MGSMRIVRGVGWRIMIMFIYRGRRSLRRFRRSCWKRVVLCGRVRVSWSCSS